ncbi:ankyrin repeat domain-containing 39-like isoform X1 isoform B [Chlorella sorokiniana]|uniref:Ankyrin repeat domain-containing 39-like isoform X1 isoform B n=1 Tax=Chlorella sorokiniana TaxID=3076 RepID=A0A2P6TH88_CHLSO|nr:ankyrin repeat domain-containing 39-like isoform X1 isoform B [Chlorella sorokiniana]|eukprot:PRW33658.1 ankyrin repeat domain-containing 39-like isoform X1 isoform B [Chlorella sorokiniana]
MAAVAPPPAGPPLLRRVSPAPTALSPAIWAAAEAGDTDTVLQLFEAEGYRSIDARSMYQSTLLHAAARHGHVQLAAALLQRGSGVNELDYGGMRRTPLHWACRGGHVALVELLVAAGADTKADGRCWSKLVQGARCGSLIPKDSPTESAESLCRNNAVRLALTRPQWTPELHHMWPQRFRDAVRLLLLACSCSCGAAAYMDLDAAAGSDAANAGKQLPATLPLSRDIVLEVAAAAAYPVSAWL